MLTNMKRLVEPLYCTSEPFTKCHVKSAIIGLGFFKPKHHHDLFPVLRPSSLREPLSGLRLQLDTKSGWQRPTALGVFFLGFRCNVVWRKRRTSSRKVGLGAVPLMSRLLFRWRRDEVNFAHVT